MTRHTEVAIIGGGIVGCAVAYYTSKYGSDVVVIEKGELASGTSSHCDGNILAIDKEPGFDSQMTLQSQQLVHELSEELKKEFEYRQPGSILVCEDEEEMEMAEQWVNKQVQAGLSFRLLDQADLRNETPYLATDLLGGLECASDSTVNPYLFSYALFAAAKTRGATLWKNTSVRSIAKQSQHYVIETSNGTITADKVVNCGGVWAPKIGQMLGITIPILPRKGHILVSSRQVPVSPRKVMEFSYLMTKFGKERKVDRETEAYGAALVFEPTASQNFLLGSSREFVGFDNTVNWHAVRAIARRCIRFYPVLRDMSLLRVYFGFRPWVADHLPIISEVAAYPGYYIAAGHEGDGIGLAPITGKVIAEMIHQKTPSIEVEQLRNDRFSQREAIT
ncbi:NAD(P)/FAD-dependent oxidoreductase [Aureibacillus halotolerans]|uniref:Sarcosine oxidase subunit beta n=1 Tax=Aureibacillus halotolerans TaxID=1508390 RepID=A0A4R6TYY1_9BACI|nr:FAD-binding oxidoreductase [Aureibacillus halotolerans]TDQ35445.1 sarcosine oxidase subunit beta [Aureibacillus halotolerans]